MYIDLKSNDNMIHRYAVRVLSCEGSELSLEMTSSNGQSRSMLTLNAESNHVAETWAAKIRSMQTSYAEHCVTQKGIDEILKLGKDLAVQTELSETEKRLLEAAVLVEGLANKLRCTINGCNS